MIILDVEIKKAIPARNEPTIDGIEYCFGWRDFPGMGIACVCTYDITTHLSRVFLEEDLQELVAYLHSKPTAGFNTNRFDIPLLQENGVVPDRTVGMHYDILEEIGAALGYHPQRPVRGWNLNDVCTATLGISKPDDGELMPVWWQQGKRGKVIDYCLNDVWMEGSLLRHVLEDGVVTNGKDQVRVAPPKFLTAEQREAVERSQNIIGRQYGAAQAKEFAELGKAFEEEAVAPLNTTPGGLGIIR